MLFSIIIPVYNVERYLRECLDSVASQTFEDYEVVIVDDGSTDNSGAIADSFAAQRDHWSVLHGKNTGLLLARRRGLKAAQGRYVLFLDSDDALRADALERISNVLLDTGADIVLFDYSRRQDFSISDDAASLEPGLYDGDDWPKVLSTALRGRINNLWSKAIRMECIDARKEYDRFAGLMMGEDLFQLLPILDLSKSLVRIKDILYFYRPNETSSTSEYKHSYLSDIERVARRVKMYGERWGMPNEGSHGALQLYVNLAHMLSDAAPQIDRASMMREISHLSSSLCRIISDPEIAARGMRTDNRLCILALQQGNPSLLRLGTAVFHLGRRALRRSV